jgi:hypothetical protein
MGQHHINITEGLESNDLKRLVHDELHIDEYKSKMGKDEDVVVVSFKIIGREPAADLVNFIEKGYDWVIDADISAGELDDGDFIVFVEADRIPDLAENIILMMEDIMRLTDQKLTNWRLIARSNPEEHPVTADAIRLLIPLTTEDYLRRYGNKALDEMKLAAGVSVSTVAPKNDHTNLVRTLAGII